MSKSMLKTIAARALRRWIPRTQRNRIRRLLQPGWVDEVDLVYRLLRKGRDGRLMVDVGAHHGAALEAFARDGWKVLAFEPDPDNRAVLESALRWEWRVKVDCRALSDCEAEALPFFKSSLSSGISSLTSFHESHEVEGHVEVTTLARVLEAEKFDQVDFLKIDVEGMDLAVLRGFPWHAMSPDVVVCEFEDAKTRPLGHGYRDIADYLIQRGYRVLLSEWYPIVAYGGNHRWRRFTHYPCALADDDAWGNLIAVRSDSDFEALCQLARVSEAPAS